MKTEQRTVPQEYTVQVPETYTEEVEVQVCVRVPKTIQVPVATCGGCNTCVTSCGSDCGSRFGCRTRCGSRVRTGGCFGRRKNACGCN